MKPITLADILPPDDLTEIVRLARRGNRWARRKLCRHIAIEDQADAAVRDTLDQTKPEYSRTGLGIPQE